MVYNIRVKNKAEHSALTSTPVVMLVNSLPLGAIVPGVLPCGDVMSLYGYFFRLEVLNY